MTRRSSVGHKGQKSSPVGVTHSDSASDLTERTFNSSTSSGYTSGGEGLPGNHSVPPGTNRNGCAHNDLRSKDGLKLLEDSLKVLRREKKPERLTNRNSYHGSRSSNNHQQNSSHRSSFHDNSASRNGISDDVLKKNLLNHRHAVFAKLHQSKSLGDFTHVRSSEHLDYRDRNFHQESTTNFRSNATFTPNNGSRENFEDSPPEGRRNPLGVLSPGEPSPGDPVWVLDPQRAEEPCVGTGDHYESRAPGVPRPGSPSCICENEHCDRYWQQRHSTRQERPPTPPRYCSVIDVTTSAIYVKDSTSDVEHVSTFHHKDSQNLTSFAQDARDTTKTTYDVSGVTSNSYVGDVKTSASTVRDVKRSTCSVNVQSCWGFDAVSFTFLVFASLSPLRGSGPWGVSPSPIFFKSTDMRLAGMSTSASRRCEKLCRHWAGRVKRVARKFGLASGAGGWDQHTAVRRGNPGT